MIWAIAVGTQRSSSRTLAILPDAVKVAGILYPASHRCTVRRDSNGYISRQARDPSKGVRTS